MIVDDRDELAKFARLPRRVTALHRTVASLVQSVYDIVDDHFRLSLAASNRALEILRHVDNRNKPDSQSEPICQARRTLDHFTNTRHYTSPCLGRHACRVRPAHPSVAD